MPNRSTLRNEIQTSKARIFRLTVGGNLAAPAIPAGQYLSHAYATGTTTLALPLIIIILVLLFVSENHAVIGASRYILQEVEIDYDERCG